MVGVSARTVGNLSPQSLPVELPAHAIDGAKAPIHEGGRPPSSSLLDGLGRVCRVQAMPASAGRFASLDTAATAKGGQLRGGRGRSRARDSPGRPAPGHDHRAISVQLAPVNQGQSRVLAVHGPGWSATPAGRIGRIPKLIVRVRFSSPAPQSPSSTYWWSAQPGVPGLDARTFVPLDARRSAITAYQLFRLTLPALIAKLRRTPAVRLRTSHRARASHGR